MFDQPWTRSVAALALLALSPAAAAQNLFVSAESAQFENFFSGPQVVEVIVVDPTINDTEQPQVEPDVTINGFALRMAQAADGNWYAYFADRDHAVMADSTAPPSQSGAAGNGLDFGTFCSNTGTPALGVSGFGFSGTVGVAVPIDVGSDGGTASAPLVGTNTDSCVGSFLFGGLINVVRKPLPLSNIPSAARGGQISVSPAIWPFVQLYDLTVAGNVAVTYTKNGNPQTVVLTYDEVRDFADMDLDRSSYPRGADVHLTISDTWMNIDPTDEDSWTFATNTDEPTSVGTYYRVFNEDGGQEGDAVSGGAVRLDQQDLADLLCDDNCQFFVDVDPLATGNAVLTLQDNEDSAIFGAEPGNPFTFRSIGSQVPTGSVPVTFTEQSASSGVFSSTDEAGVSNLRVRDSATRGTFASVDYNDTALSVLVGHFTGNIDIRPTAVAWPTGDEIPILVVDADLNKNSRHDEDLDVFDPNVEQVPSLVSGIPVTPENTASATFDPLGADVDLFERVEPISQRLFLRTPLLSDLAVGDGDEIRIDLGIDFAELYASTLR